jgi:small subunit ribosomal protein S1
MTKKDIFGDELRSSETRSKESDFASLFEQSLAQAGRSFKVGDQFKAEILSIGQEEAFLSTGSPQDAIILRSELLDENQNLKFKIGEQLEVVVIKVKGGEIRVARKGSRKSAVDFDSLQDAFDMEIPVEGRVLELVKGGFRVDIQGQKAFCPISQIDSQFVQSGEEYVGKKLEFLITQLDQLGRNIVVSRKKVLQIQRVENEGLWMEKHNVGDVLSGIVTRLEAFGAFIKLDGGVEGLVHISEIGFVRIKHASESLKVGETVQVKILKIEEDGDRLKISLSIKQAGGVGDPWLQVPVHFPVGTILNAIVEKKENFGIFIQIIPGVTGLLPRSKWKESVEAAQYEAKKKGDAIQVRIDQILFEERKISLGLPTEAEDLSWKSHSSSASGGFGALAAAFQKASTVKKTDR